MTENYTESDIIQLPTNRKNWWVDHLSHKALEHIVETIETNAATHELDHILSLVITLPSI